MTKISFFLDDTTYLFYHRIAQATEKPVEQVIHDALFKLAGELSLEALKNSPHFL